MLPITFSEHGLLVKSGSQRRGSDRSCERRLARWNWGPAHSPRWWKPERDPIAL